MEPNAGLPELVDGQTMFRLGPDEFARQTSAAVRRGVQCIGGCCGTTPDHIRALASVVRSIVPEPAEQSSRPCVVLTSRSTSLPLGFEYKSQIIGERINPTGKKDLIAQFQEGDVTRALELAQEQVDMGSEPWM